MPHSEYDAQQEQHLNKACRLEYISLLYMLSVIVLMYLVMGSSQAMKTAWIEDCLSLIPPLSFLIGAHICNRSPNRHFPYGFHRAVSVLFLCAALALLVMGSYLIVDSAIKLVEAQHPSIGMKNFLGHDMWLGWWMILVLLWGTFPPIILGHFKMKHAGPLNDKILYTDAKMNKADWMTAVAAIGGVLGIGYGLWWADAAAALVISFDILKDGWTQTKDATLGLMNRSPTEIDNGYSDLSDRARKKLLEYDFIQSAEVKLYEAGHLIFGQGYVHFQQDVIPSQKQIKAATRAVRKLDWRLKEFSISLAVWRQTNHPAFTSFKIALFMPLFQRIRAEPVKGAIIFKRADLDPVCLAFQHIVVS